jgi:hypothetical protein
MIGGIVLSLYKTDTKKFKKKVSYNVEKIDTLKVYTIPPITINTAHDAIIFFIV